MIASAKKTFKGKCKLVDYAYSWALRATGSYSIDYKKTDDLLDMTSGDLKIYKRNLRSIVGICRANGIKVVFLDLPFSKSNEHYYPKRKGGLRVSVREFFYC